MDVSVVLLGRFGSVVDAQLENGETNRRKRETTETNDVRKAITEKPK